MTLYQKRKRDRERAKAAADGSLPAPTRDLLSPVRMKLVYALRDATPRERANDFFQGIQHIVCRQWGKEDLAGWGAQLCQDDVENCLKSLSTSSEEVLDLLEAAFISLVAVAGSAEFSYQKDQAQQGVEKLRARVNAVFDEHDIGWQIVGHEAVDRDSLAIHAQVVGPVTSLLRGEVRFAAVEKAYQDALRELKPKGNPSDAITDAGTALQEMLSAVGCKGNALGQLLTDAEKKGFLGPYDSKLAEGVRLIGDWVSADRSTRGDAHSAADADRDDAWLAVNVAGSLILRLSKHA